MAKEEIIESVGQCLFAEQDTNVFAVLDGASVPGLLDKLYTLSPNFCCLFRGELQPDMAEVAPYLVQLESGSEFTNWIIRQGWGNHWGIFASSEADFRQMRTHFRTFLIVYDETGRPLRFRYYDPRVLRTFLPTCTTEELTTLFGPITSYIAEDANPDALLWFQMQSGALKQKQISIGQS
ncbi:MAG TPA: DUF4123 domain-containing protein [Blastocatellia bacterium]|nr:DUF4123 domain-containing protein [Blastocatellia bacterium]